MYNEIRLPRSYGVSVMYDETRLPGSCGVSVILYDETRLLCCMDMVIGLFCGAREVVGFRSNSYRGLLW